MARVLTFSKNVQACLDMLGWSEGTITSKITKDEGYDIIVTGVAGPERFSDYSKHPFEGGRKAKQINSKGLYSTASGKYQMLLRTWIYYRGLLKLPDFSPASQDKAAWYMFRERKAHNLVEAGLIEDAIKIMAPIWASLPGTGYPGQGQRTMAQCVAAFQRYGGQLWESSTSSPEEVAGSLLQPQLSSLPSATLQKYGEISASPTKTSSLGQTLNELLQRMLQLWKGNRK